MKIINKVTEESYAQWIEDFVKTVINKANLDCKEVIIDDIEFSKYIFLIIDGEEYDIRTWNFHTIKTDNNGNPCAEVVRYTLFKMIMDNEHSGHGEEICDGHVRIKWSNE